MRPDTLISYFFDETGVLSLLQSVEAMSGCRDRSRLPEFLLRAVGGALSAGADVGLFLREPTGKSALKLFSGPGCDARAQALWLPLIAEMPVDGALLQRAVDGRGCGLLALHTSELCAEQIILAYALQTEAGERAETDVVLSLARIYGHQLRLLDYGELDSLTRLLNRKTFEETFDRLVLASANACECRIGERRLLSEHQPAWLCVIDIDHFKRVNDTFGHLFGDEVLLRMGDLMRRTFRGGDRLFRFGGEEFVVLLNAADQAHAVLGFERFRQSVEQHEFPQVGMVTCSIGFTAVGPSDVPIDVLGRADKALYYAKASGRNRVCAYETLVREGLIVRSPVVDATPATGFDIDALFN